MECRTSGALRRKALGRILDLFPNDRDVYENWQKYAQIYAMGYKDAPDNMDDIVDYWGSLGHDYTLASNRPRRNVSKLPNRILSKKKLMMTTKIL